MAHQDQLPVEVETTPNRASGLLPSRSSPALRGARKRPTAKRTTSTSRKSSGNSHTVPPNAIPVTDLRILREATSGAACAGLASEEAPVPVRPDLPSQKGPPPQPHPGLSELDCGGKR